MSTQELAASIATKFNNVKGNGKVYGGVNEPLHTYVNGEKVNVDESFASVYQSAYEASYSDEGFDAQLESEESYYNYVLSTLN